MSPSQIPRYIKVEAEAEGVVAMSMSRTTQVLLAVRQLLMKWDIIRILLKRNRSKVRRVILMNRVMILEQNTKRGLGSATIVIPRDILHLSVENLEVVHINATELMTMELIPAEWKSVQKEMV